MLIPKGTGIKDFIDRYFVEDAMPDEPVINEQVRVVYYEIEGTKLGSPHVTRKMLAFDVYNVSSDRLKRRDKLIVQRIKELLTGQTHVCHLRFQYEDDYHLGTKTIGYRRYHAVFSYITTW